MIKYISKYFKGREAGMDVVRATSKCRIILHCALISFYIKCFIDVDHGQSGNEIFGMYDCPDLVFNFPVLAVDLILSCLKVFLF